MPAGRKKRKESRLQGFDLSHGTQECYARKVQMEPLTSKQVRVFDTPIEQCNTWYTHPRNFWLPQLYTGTKGKYMFVESENNNYRTVPDGPNVQL